MKSASKTGKKERRKLREWDVLEARKIKVFKEVMSDHLCWVLLKSQVREGLRINH